MTIGPARGRVLAAADSALVRRAIARELCPSFDLLFAERYADALGFLATTPLAAVVVDRRVGGALDGDDLLVEVSRRQPAAVRVLLCDLAAPFRIGAAQAALMRPWEAGELASAVSRLLARPAPCVRRERVTDGSRPPGSD